MKLFMIQIGFRLPGMNTEGHDTLFCVAEDKESAFRIIKKKRNYADHIDTCLEIRQVEGYEVHPVSTASATSKKELNLWFINLGGYREKHFGEEHKCLLVLAHDLQEAKAKAKQDPFFKEPGRVQDSVAAPHIDDKHCLDEGIDDVLCVSQELSGFTLEFTQAKQAEENPLTIEYVPLKG